MQGRGKLDYGQEAPCSAWDLRWSRASDPHCSCSQALQRLHTDVVLVLWAKPPALQTPALQTLTPLGFLAEYFLLGFAFFS